MFHSNVSKALKRVLGGVALAIVGMTIFVVPAAAQGEGVHLGVGFLSGIPQGEFRDHTSNAGFGVNVNLGYNPANTPLVVGIDGGFMNYGSESRREPLSPTIPDVTVEVDNNNNIILGHVFLRLQPQTGFFRPYVEGSAGVNYFFTETTVSNEYEDDDVFHSTNLDDAAFGYGIGGGLMFRLGTVDDFGDDDSDEPGSMDILLDLRGRYIWGGEAEYLKEGSIRRETGTVEYDIERSKTDMLLLQIGVSLRFGG